MKTIKNQLFKRLLDKTTYVFHHKIVYAYFDSEYYYLEAERDFVSGKTKIEFTDENENEIELTEEQYKMLDAKIEEKYNEEIENYTFCNGIKTVSEDFNDSL